MSRLKLSFPKPSLFKTSLEVRIQDINYGGHVGNDRVLGIMHEARLQWLNSMGYPTEIGLDGNTGIIITESHIQYRSEAFYGDKLQVELSLADIGEVGFDIFYNIFNATSEKVTAIGKTAVLFFDYETRKINKIPVEFKTKIGHGQ